MKKLIIILTAVLSFSCVFATEIDNSSIMASLNLKSDNMPSTGKVGFAKEAIATSTDAETSTKIYADQSDTSQLTLVPDSSNDGHAILSAETPLYIFAVINSNKQCEVTISANSMTGYASADDKDSPVTNALNWTIKNDESDPTYTYSLDTAGENSDVIVFEHEGTTYSKVYSSKVYVETADYRGKDTNYYEGVITVTLTDNAT